MSYFQPYKYIKDESKDPIFKPVNKKFAMKVLAYPVVLTAIGIFFLITQVVFPLVVFSSESVYRPVESTVLGVASGFREFEFSELEDSVSVKPKDNIPDYYYLTVPKLGIERALVETSPADLNPDEALGHYIGSDMPGESGNSFIYGHSVLPAFYNPKNYKTIFSTLDKLEVGDDFTIEYNNKILKYVVHNKVELKPDKVDPLGGFRPAYLNESTVTLMTCSPAGTKINRLMINAILVNE